MILQQLVSLLISLIFRIYFLERFFCTLHRRNSDADTLFSIFMRLCIWDFRDLTFQNLAMHFANNWGLGDLAMHLAVKILHQGNAATVQTFNC